jgi:hypothetical protein
MPGLPPKIFGFREDNENGALLLEFLTGVRFRRWF